VFDNSAKTRIGKTASTAVYNCALRIFHPLRGTIPEYKGRRKKRTVGFLKMVDIEIERKKSVVANE
jgi:hypothetical protein